MYAEKNISSTRPQTVIIRITSHLFLGQASLVRSFYKDNIITLTNTRKCIDLLINVNSDTDPGPPFDTINFTVKHALSGLSSSTKMSRLCQVLQ